MHFYFLSYQTLAYTHIPLSFFPHCIDFLSILCAVLMLLIPGKPPSTSNCVQGSISSRGDAQLLGQGCRCLAEDAESQGSEPATSQCDNRRRFPWCCSFPLGSVLFYRAFPSSIAGLWTNPEQGTITKLGTLKGAKGKTNCLNCLQGTMMGFVLFRFSWFTSVLFCFAMWKQSSLCCKGFLV